MNHSAKVLLAMAAWLALSGLASTQAQTVKPRESEPVSQLIDREIGKRLQEAKIPPSSLADDAEFLRRVYLDLNGRIPTADKAKAFLDSKDPEKRRKLIDELLASPMYGNH